MMVRMAHRARSLVMDLFGDYLRYAGGEARLSCLVELLEVFGVEPATTRVTLSRMRKDGWFETRRVGRETVYVLTDRMDAVLVDGRERIFVRPDEGWDGVWTQLIYQVPESARSVRISLRKQLTWLGFGQLAPSTWLSPHAPSEQIADLRGDFPDATIDVFRTVVEAPGADRDLAARCWDLGELARDYRRFLERYRALDETDDLPVGGAALVARTEVVAEARRLTFRDPGLPAALEPDGWPGGEGFALFRRVHARLAPAAEACVEQVLGLRLEDEADRRQYL